MTTAREVVPSPDGQAMYLLAGDRLDRYRHSESGWAIEWSFFGAAGLHRLEIADDGLVEVTDGQGRLFVVRGDGRVLVSQDSYAPSQS